MISDIVSLIERQFLMLNYVLFNIGKEKITQVTRDTYAIYYEFPLIVTKLQSKIAEKQKYHEKEVNTKI